MPVSQHRTVKTREGERVVSGSIRLKRHKCLPTNVRYFLAEEAPEDEESEEEDIDDVLDRGSVKKMSVSIMRNVPREETANA